MDTLSLSATAVRSPEALNVWKCDCGHHWLQGQSTRPQHICRLSLQKHVDWRWPTQSQMKLIINELCCYGNKQENCSNAVNLAGLGERQMVHGLVRNKDESSKSSDVTMQRSKRANSCLNLIKPKQHLSFTCENVISVQLHVHLVLLCDAAHDPLGTAVLLSGQQPAQWLGEDPDGEKWKLRWCENKSSL